MKQHTFLSKLAMSIACILIPGFSLAQHNQLSLKQGTYVVASSDCKEPAFAVIKSWDGVGFSGSHSSKCTSRVLSRQGNQFTMSTTCAALGNGTPDRSGYVDNFLLTRLSNTRFNVRKDKSPHPETTYRWCSAK
jgi:hypothetical protein